MKTKQLLFTIALFFAVAFMNAQDKYEFMIIEYNTYNSRISISIDGAKFSDENVKLPKDENSNTNANPFLKKIKEYQDENWEILSIDNTFMGVTEVHFANLRRKIK